MTAFIGSLLGLGGGVVLIPTMLLLSQYVHDFAWASPQMIVGISLIVMVFTALSSTISYFRKGRVDYKTGLYFLSGSIPGSIIGAWLNQYIDANDFSLYFGFIMVIISFLFLIKREPRSLGNTKQDNSIRTFKVDGEIYHYRISVWTAFYISLGVGILSGMFGIGGGSIMVPVMILFFGVPTHIATATSMFMILFISIMSAGTHIMLGHIVWEYTLLFIPGAWIGGKIGARVNQSLNSKALEWILRIILVLIGLRLIIEGLA